MMTAPQIKVLILCAGYGTRLKRDLCALPASDPLHKLKDLPKPLLPIGRHNSVVEYWLSVIQDCRQKGGPITEKDIYLVTNEHYYNVFVELAQSCGFPTTNIVNDGTTCNENRLGAVADIDFACQHFGICHHSNTQQYLLVIGGDTVFFQDFDLGPILSATTALPNERNAMLVYNSVPDSEVESTGIIELDEHGVVTKCWEKPKLEEVSSRLSFPCLYVFTPNGMRVLVEFLQKCRREKLDLKEYDSPGRLVRYLSLHEGRVSAMPVSGSFDIGALTRYRAACDYFSRHPQD